MPPNAGSFRRLRIHLRENCCVGIPRHPTSCSVATTNLSDRVTNPVQRALAELADGFGMAEMGLAIAPGAAVIAGADPRADGAPFINQIYFGLSGGAAGPAADGWLSMGSVCTGGVMLRDSVEVDELHHPIRVLEQRIVPDTEGAGRFRGTPNVYCEYGPVDCTLSVMYASDGTVNPGRGARGGLDGPPAGQWKRTTSGELVELPPFGQVMLAPGETIISLWAGGGGYGPPVERDPERVAHDVREGWVTRERAAKVYGVAIDESGHVDREATEALRRRHAATAGEVEVDAG